MYYNIKLENNLYTVYFSSNAVTWGKLGAWATISAAGEAIKKDLISVDGIFV